jgi:endonuclease/exonuclease/phosphatase (EEP) superfamily protein YafD
VALEWSSTSERQEQQLRRAFKITGLVTIGILFLFVAGVTVLELPTGLPPPTDRHGASLRIAAANLAFDNQESGAAGRRVAALEADLLILLEWTGENADGHEGQDSWNVLLDEPRRGAHGVRVLARPSLEAEAELVAAPVDGPCPMPVATARVRFGREWLGILGIHAPPPIEDCGETNGPTLTALAGLVDDGRLLEDVGAARRGDRVVMAGDFNALPGSAEMAPLRYVGLVDTHTSRHWRPIGTWTPAKSIPHLLRIDYVLAPRDLPVVGSWTVELPGSDHRAVAAELAPPD